MQIAADIGDGEKGLPNCNESEKQKRNGPTRFDTIHPAQKRPSPTRRRNPRARGHGRDCNIHRHATNSLPAVGKTNSSSRASRKVKIRPALQDSFEIFIKKSSCLKSKPMMERLRLYSFKSCSSAKAVIDGGLCHFGSSDPIQQRLHVPGMEAFAIGMRGILLGQHSRSQERCHPTGVRRAAAYGASGHAAAARREKNQHDPILVATASLIGICFCANVKIGANQTMSQPKSPDCRHLVILHSHWRVTD
jgi:hypothetical protein